MFCVSRNIVKINIGSNHFIRSRLNSFTVGAVDSIIITSTDYTVASVVRCPAGIEYLKVHFYPILNLVYSRYAFWNGLQKLEKTCFKKKFPLWNCYVEVGKTLFYITMAIRAFDNKKDFYCSCADYFSKYIYAETHTTCSLKHTSYKHIGR